MKKISEWMKQHYYFLYTIFFILTALLVYAQFMINGRSFIYADENQGGDGLVQHYNSFVYYGEYLRKIIKTLLLDHQLVIPMWDRSIGFGQDIINTLSYYVIGDPFAAMSVFFPKEYGELGYCCMILLRLYCAGIAFSAYCRHRGYHSVITLAGSLVYCFCAYALISSALHPYFILPMIFLPLLLIGCDKILTDSGSVFYTVVLAIAGIANFYFFYMLCIMVVIYTVIRYIEINKKIEFLRVIRYVGRFAAASVIGICASSVLLLPSVMNILTSSRLSSEHYLPLFYDPDYYENILPIFVTGSMSDYSSLGFTGMALIAVVLLVMRARKNRSYRFLAVMMGMNLLFFVLPFFGHMFNGMSYVTNRWVWGFAFMTAYVLVVIWTETEKIKRNEWKALGGVLFSAYILVMLSGKAANNNNAYGLAIFGATLFLIRVGMKRDGRWLKYRTPAVVGICILSLGINSYIFYSPDVNDYIRNHVDQGKAYEMLVEESPGAVVKEIGDEDLYRYDTVYMSMGEVRRNSSMQLGLGSTAYYYSSTDGQISEFMHSLYINNTMDQSRVDLGGRAYLDQLLGVKYVAAKIEEGKSLPYGYNQLAAVKNNYVVYKAEQAVPFGFVSYNYMSSGNFEKLSVTERQQALLQTVVADPERVTDRADIEYRDEEQSYTMELGDHVNRLGTGYRVDQADSSITLNFNGVSKCELYLIVENMEYEPLTFQDIQKSLPEELSAYDSRKLKKESMDSLGETKTAINISSGSSNDEIRYKTWKDNYYCGYNDFLGNLGYSEKIRKSIRITFKKPGKYRFDRIKVVSQSMEGLEQYVATRVENQMRHMRLETNELDGSVELDRRGLLCVQIPYSKGWKAFVDGKETEVLKANLLFSAIELEAGWHDIVFKYESPGLKPAGLLSLAGIGMIVLIGIIEKIRKKKKVKKPEEAPGEEK